MAQFVDLIRDLHREHQRVANAVKDKQYALRQQNEHAVALANVRQQLGRAITGRKVRVQDGVGTVIASYPNTFQLDNYEAYTYEEILEVL